MNLRKEYKDALDIIHEQQKEIETLKADLQVARSELGEVEKWRDAYRKVCEENGLSL